MPADNQVKPDASVAFARLRTVQEDTDAGASPLWDQYELALFLLCGNQDAGVEALLGILRSDRATAELRALVEKRLADLNADGGAPHGPEH